MAEDSRIERGRQIRDEILLKRGSPAKPAPREDPFEEAVLAARERLAEIDAEIAAKRLHSQGLAAPRDKLAARSEELAAAAAKVETENRARVEAIYRSAKLGAGAAGWHTEPAKSARLSRYLAAIATVQNRKLEVAEVEHGSAIAALDRARADDAAAAAELRVLAADRAEAESRLGHALAEAGQGGDVGDIVVAAADEMDGQGDEANYPDIGAPVPAADESAMPGATAAVDPRRGVEPAAGSGDELDESALEVERALQELAAKSARAEALKAEALKEAQVQKEAEALKEAEASKNAEALKEAEAQKTAEAQKKAEAAGREGDPVVDAIAEDSEKAPSAPAPGAPDARAIADSKATNAPPVSKPGAAPDSEDAATVRPGDATAEAKAAGESADAAPAADSPTPAKPRGLLSRIFGNNRDADAFSASRGTLPAPVAGKVVANYGQQHKSGATYRGVILRAGHSEPIKAVAGGQVSFAGNVPGLGNTVIVSHGGRYHTVYARLGSVQVKEGQSVTAGSRLGELPEDNADMHFELRDKGKAIDPMPWLKSGIPGAAP